MTQRTLPTANVTFFNDEHKSNESLTTSPEVGIAQNFDGCALRSRKSVPKAAKVRAQENGD